MTTIITTNKITPESVRLCERIAKRTGGQTTIKDGVLMVVTQRNNKKIERTNSDNNQTGATIDGLQEANYAEWKAWDIKDREDEAAGEAAIEAWMIGLMA